MSSQEGWLAMLSGPTAPEVELVVVPGAGDGPTTARTLPAHLPPSWRLSSVCLPGRGHRFDEDLADDPYAVLAAIVDAVDSLGPAPVVLLGHSLGALWALEAGGGLARPPALVATVACAAPAPGGASGLEGPDDTEDRRFIRGLLMDQGLDDPECLDELVDLTVPVFHADLMLAARWTAPERPVLDCPVVSYFGSRDGLAPAPWTRHTTGPAEAVWLEGGHHVHQEQSAGLLADLSRRAAPYLARRDGADLTQRLRGPLLAGHSGSSR
ncbi:thioesterase II family protein [Streptomyces sp. NPDC088097]|uniref:thioesterase II family protein n=1 Tax=Streptomyces sp. NPDC088097 TaxID=3365823 RepID=UPI0037FDBD67